MFNDSDIRSLWLGRRPGAERNEASSCLDDLAGYDLVVVRLRPIRHGATTSALIEAIDQAAMLWLVESPGLPLAAGHPAWSDELAEMLRERNFAHLDLAPADVDLDAAMAVER